MENYKLPSAEIYKILRDKGLQYLYHANTVSTSLTFIKQNALLSREYVESNNLIQTGQKSDSGDKKHDVWNHVFLDGEDLHSRYRQENHYGPITFRFRLELLNSPELEHIYITKSNPIYWKDSTPLEKKFYADIDEIKTDYLTGKRLDSQIMFTFKDTQKALKLSNFLIAVGIDNPKIFIKLRSGGMKNVGEYTFEKISKTMHDSGLDSIPVYYRHENESPYCRCNLHYTYLYNLSYPEFEKKFYPYE